MHLKEKQFIRLGIFIPLLMPPYWVFFRGLDFCNNLLLEKYFLTTTFILHIIAIIYARKVFFNYSLLNRLFILFLPFIYWLTIDIVFLICFTAFFC